MSPLPRALRRARLLTTSALAASTLLVGGLGVHLAVAQKQTGNVSAVSTTKRSAATPSTTASTTSKKSTTSSSRSGTSSGSRSALSSAGSVSNSQSQAQTTTSGS